MPPVNLESVAYIGDRDAIAMEWKSRRYTFKHGVSVRVPSDFAAVLLKGTRFIRSDDLRRSVVENYPIPCTLLFRRWGALGDLLIFRAAVAAFLRRYRDYKVVLRCQTQFAHVFYDDPLWAGFKPIGMVGDEIDVDGVATFDQVAEADHRGVQQHRCRLFLNAMSTERIAVTREDWRMPVPPATNAWVKMFLNTRKLLREQRERPLVAVQVRGSAQLKTLPDGVLRSVVGSLLVRGLDIILLEHDADVAQKFVNSRRVHTMPGRDALHAIELLRHVDLAITMDSGPLWMAHAAPCPVLALLGPTKAEQRISFHPDFPTKARAIQLNDIINCPACFEAAKKCGGKYTCIRNQPDWKVVVGRIVDEAAAMVHGDIRLPVVDAPVENPASSPV